MAIYFMFHSTAVLVVGRDVNSSINTSLGSIPFLLNVVGTGNAQ